MLENDITDVITETFSLVSDDFGAERVVDLIPDGRNVAVTEANKHEYVRLVTEYRLHASVKEQMENFLKGMFVLRLVTLMLWLIYVKVSMISFLQNLLPYSMSKNWSCSFQDCQTLMLMIGGTTLSKRILFFSFFILVMDSVS